MTKQMIYTVYAAGAALLLASGTAQAQSRAPTTPATPGLVAPDPPHGPLPAASGQLGTADVTAGLSGTLRLDKRSAGVGETVHFTYTVVNTGKTPAVLTFPTTQQFDVQATLTVRTPTAHLRPLWRASDGQMFGQMVSRVSLAPGESRTFTGAWQIAGVSPGQLVNLSATLRSRESFRSPVAGASARVAIRGRKDRSYRP